MTLPPRLESFAAAIGAAINSVNGVWIASLDLNGCWPIPDGSVSFGKGSKDCVPGRVVRCELLPS